MKLFKRRKLEVIRVPGPLTVDVAPPLRGKGTYKVRRFSGMYVCGCKVNQFKMITLVNEGRNPSDEMFCQTHRTPILYHEEEELPMHFDEEA
jgi:hypothetical protein